MPKTINPVSEVNQQVRAQRVAPKLDGHSYFKQFALNKFAEELRKPEAGVLKCHSLLRQSFEGAREGGAPSDMDIRKLALNREDSWKSRKCPESAALAVIACIYEVFGDKILTPGTNSEVDWPRLKTALYLMFGTEMAEIGPDIEDMFHKLSFIGDGRHGLLSTGKYTIPVQHHQLPGEDLVKLFRSGCADTTFFFHQPEAELDHFFGADRPEELNGITNLSKTVFRPVKSLRDLGLVREQANKMKQGQPIYHNQVDLQLSTGELIVTTSKAAFVLDSAPSHARELTKKIFKAQGGRFELQQKIREHFAYFSQLPEDVARPKLIQSVSPEKIQWLVNQPTRLLAGIETKLAEARASHEQEHRHRQLRIQIDHSQADQIEFIPDANDEGLDVAAEPVAQKAAYLAPEAVRSQALPATVDDIFLLPPNTWSLKTSIKFGNAAQQDSELFLVPSLASKTDGQNAVDATKIIERMATGPIPGHKTEIVAFDIRMYSTISERQLWTGHVKAMEAGCRQYNESHEDEPQFSYVPIHSRAEDAVRAGLNYVRDQLGIANDNFMSAGQDARAVSEMNRIFKTMSVENQHRYGPVLELWDQLYRARNIQGNTSLLVTLTSLLMDAVNNDPASPIKMVTVAGCKSAVDRSTSVPAVMKMLKAVIQFALTKDLGPGWLRDYLQRIIDVSIGQIRRNELTADERLIMKSNYDPKLLVAVSGANTGKFSNVNVETLGTTMAQFPNLNGAGANTGARTH